VPIAEDQGVSDKNENIDKHHHLPDAIIFDNMPPSAIREGVTLCKRPIYLEASGGINLQNICSYAETGVNGISVGKLTHSIKAIDMSIEIRRN